MKSKISKCHEASLKMAHGGAVEAADDDDLTRHGLRAAMSKGRMMGKVEGKGGPKDDAIPARLSDGEYVLPADVVQQIGVQNLDQMVAQMHDFSGGPSLRGNAYADGGRVDQYYHQRDYGSPRMIDDRTMAGKSAGLPHQADRERQIDNTLTSNPRGSVSIDNIRALQAADDARLMRAAEANRQIEEKRGMRSFADGGEVVDPKRALVTRPNWNYYSGPAAPEPVASSVPPGQNVVSRPNWTLGGNPYQQPAQPNTIDVKPERPLSPQAQQHLASQGAQAEAFGERGPVRPAGTPPAGAAAAGESGAYRAGRVLGQGVRSLTLNAPTSAFVTLPAAAQSVNEGYTTPTEVYARRLGIDPKAEQSFLGDVGVRAAGVMSDFGANMLDFGTSVVNAIKPGQPVEPFNDIVRRLDGVQRPGAPAAVTPTTPSPVSRTGGIPAEPTINGYGGTTPTGLRVMNGNGAAPTDPGFRPPSMSITYADDYGPKKYQGAEDAYALGRGYLPNGNRYYDSVTDIVRDPVTGFDNAVTRRAVRADGTLDREAMQRIKALNDANPEGYRSRSITMDGGTAGEAAVARADQERREAAAAAERPSIRQFAMPNIPRPEYVPVTGGHRERMNARNVNAQLQSEWIRAHQQAYGDMLRAQTDAGRNAEARYGHDVQREGNQLQYQSARERDRATAQHQQRLADQWEAKFNQDKKEYGDKAANERRKMREGSDEASVKQLESLFRTTDPKTGQNIVDNEAVAEFRNAAITTLPMMVRELEASGSPQAKEKATAIRELGFGALEPGDMQGLMQLFQTRKRMAQSKGMGLNQGTFAFSDNLLDYRQSGMEKRTFGGDRVVTPAGSISINDLRYKDGPSNAIFPDFGRTESFELTRGLRRER